MIGRWCTFDVLLCRSLACIIPLCRSFIIVTVSLSRCLKCFILLCRCLFIKIVRLCSILACIIRLSLITLVIIIRLCGDFACLIRLRRSIARVVRSGGGTLCLSSFFSSDINRTLSRRIYNRYWWNIFFFKRVCFLFLTFFNNRS